MKNISKYLLIALVAITSACSKPANTGPSELEKQKAEENTWHHCTADVDCVLVKTADCNYAVDARFQNKARDYYSQQICVDKVAEPMAVCKNNYCQVRSRR